MGLLDKIFRRKEKDKEIKNDKKEEVVDTTELTEEELDGVYGHPNGEWCPRVKVPTIDLNGKINNGRTGQTRSNEGR